MVNFPQRELEGVQALTERTLSFVLDFYKQKRPKISPAAYRPPPIMNPLTNPLGRARHQLEIADSSPVSKLGRELLSRLITAYSTYVYVYSMYYSSEVSYKMARTTDNHQLVPSLLPLNPSTLDLDNQCLPSRRSHSTPPLTK
jgi:hypothetical protein